MSTYRPKIATGKKTWVCASCDKRYKEPKDESGFICQVIPPGKKAICNGDIFDMNDSSWPCPGCDEFVVNYLDQEKNKCQACLDRGTDTTFHGL